MKLFWNLYMIVSLYGKLASLVMANETYLVLFSFFFWYSFWLWRYVTAVSYVRVHAKHGACEFTWKRKREIKEEDDHIYNVPFWTCYGGSGGCDNSMGFFIFITGWPGLISMAPLARTLINWLHEIKTFQIKKNINIMLEKNKNIIKM